ncbi:MAG: glycosyltransferase family 4 protein [Rhodospirillales bacterium]|nr:glycosyltransferase family 4 protein [Rhodospirillales bacterium]
MSRAGDDSGQGHEVTLFASGDSETAARLVPCCPKALWRDPGCREPLTHHVRQAELVAREAHRFDVAHFHTDYAHFPALGRLACPAVTTLHGRVHPPDHRPLFEAYPDAGLVSISDDQRRPVPEANWLGTVYHGLPRDLHTFREAPGTYLAFLGRLSPEKGVDKAVEIARRAGLPLKVAAKIYPDEVHYFEEVVEPLFRASPWVEFVGEVGGAAKDVFLGHARALLFPIDWAEPFGLVMIEALACGTPVVAFRRGSVPEVMADPRTGFVVDDVPGAVAAVGRIEGLSRRACRWTFIDRFDAARMARDYLAVYRELTGGGPRRGAATGHFDALAHAGGLLGPVGSAAPEVCLP